MNKDQIYETWAPQGGRWTPWVKPVLFGFVDSGVPGDGGADSGSVESSWVPSSDGSAGLVLDLPGTEGVVLGMTLAHMGFRPVPLYNAIPRPVSVAVSGFVALVDVEPILDALCRAAEDLAKLRLPFDAPPAFLLDANRAGHGLRPKPSQFDNRSVSFTTDFPSALFLQAHGVQRMILVQQTGDQPQRDFAHTLYAWQEGGVRIAMKRLDLPSGAVPCVIRKPSQFGLLWQRSLAALGLRRSPFGGFGGIVPELSSG